MKEILCSKNTAHQLQFDPHSLKCTEMRGMSLDAFATALCWLIVLNAIRKHAMVHLLFFNSKPRPHPWMVCSILRGGKSLCAHCLQYHGFGASDWQTPASYPFTSLCSSFSFPADSPLCFLQQSRWVHRPSRCVTPLTSTASSTTSCDMAFAPWSSFHRSKANCRQGRFQNQRMVPDPTEESPNNWFSHGSTQCG